MKKISLLSLALVLTISALAQWADNGSAIYNTNPGNVGIGAPNPVSKLHVEGETLINGNLRIGASTNNLGYAKTLSFDDYTSTDPIWFSRYTVSDDASEFRLNIGDDGGSGDRFVIGNIDWQTGNWLPKYYFGIDGRMGIGTTNPRSFQLAVEGKIGAREIKVTLESPWPDYVFKKDYDLMNLDILEDFIKRNKHLPNIPSAEDVVREGGIELGEMNKKLLEKIEELTLYIIELKKENEEIKKEVSVLKKKSLL